MEAAAFLFFAAILFVVCIAWLTSMPSEAATSAVTMPEQAEEREIIVVQTAPEQMPTTAAAKRPAEEAEPAALKPEPVEPEVLYDVPISDELQRYIRQECETRGVPFEIVLAMIYQESSYRPGVISETNDYGLMQVNACNHDWLRDELGITDILDPEQNIRAGVYILSQAYSRYGDDHLALMAYNMGDNGAAKAWAEGIYTSEYSRAIVEAAAELKRKEV